jgi:type I restriction enzyme S subunit
MTNTTIGKVIQRSWMDLNGLRLDSGPYLSGAFEARVALERLQAKKEPLYKLTKGFSGGIYNGPQFVRNYVDDREYGVPFITSGSMLLADFSRVALLSKRDAESAKLQHLRLSEGMTLITCSGTIGRMAYTRPDMEGFWSSQDVMKVVPDPERIPPGYLYAYLRSRYGVPMIVSGTYGAVIQHIEPRHIADLPVPRLGEAIEREAHNLVSEAARLRADYQRQVEQATALLFDAVGLRDITATEWHAQGPDLSFEQRPHSHGSLRALNYNPRFRKLKHELSQVPHKALGNLCSEGVLRSGVRFKRIDCAPEHGVRLVGQRELFWLSPEGRWISPELAPGDIFVDNETILVAAQGTLGESEVFCRAELITDPWTDFAYTQHLLRIRPGANSVSGAFLFAFVRSETAFRCLRSMSIGSKQQDIDRALLSQLPVPIPEEAVYNEVENLVRSAFSNRHLASSLESRAVVLVEQSIQETA